MVDVGTDDNEPEPTFEESFRNAFAARSDEIGRFNLAIFGKTGVGKSSLINAVFGEGVAQTGIGKPVTQEEHLYLHQSGRLGLLDTRGLEIGKDSSTLIAELASYLKQMRRKDLSDQLHVAWYCVRATDKRFEDTEADFIREVSRLGLPVILVLTQVPQRSGVPHPESVALASEIAHLQLPVHNGVAFLTMAFPDEFAGLEKHGLEALLDATFRVAPDGVASALNAAQIVDAERKRQEAHIAIGSAVTAAGVAGAVPIPFADAAILVPIQVAMMAAIALAYDVPVDRASTAALAATAAATQAGKSVVTNLLKFIPGAGQVTGGIISAAVASAVTFAMGQAWMLVCERIARGELGALGPTLDNQVIRDLFMQEFKQQVTKRLPGGK